MFNRCKRGNESRFEASSARSEADDSRSDGAGPQEYPIVIISTPGNDIRAQLAPWSAMSRSTNLAQLFVQVAWFEPVRLESDSYCGMYSH